MVYEPFLKQFWFMIKFALKFVDQYNTLAIWKFLLEFSAVILLVMQVCTKTFQQRK